MFRGSYSIHILKTNSWDVQKKLQYRYLKNRLVRVFRGSYSINYLQKCTFRVFRGSYSIHIVGCSEKLQYTYRQNKLVRCSQVVTV